jgi:hypothetical protein
MPQKTWGDEIRNAVILGALPLHVKYFKKEGEGRRKRRKRREI